MTHPAYELDLRDLLDNHYGAGNWTERTSVGVGSDIGPALVAGVAYLRANFTTGRGIIKIPPGYWLLSTPDIDISGVYVQGAGSISSYIIFNSASGIALLFNGQWSAGGVKGIALSLEYGLGLTQSYGIVLMGDSGHQPDQCNFDDVYLTSMSGNSHWKVGFQAYGNYRTSPQGIRVCNISNLQIFNCQAYGMYLSSIVQWTLMNVGTYTGHTAQGNTIRITGGGTPTTNSTQVWLLGCTSTLITDNCSKVWNNGVQIIA